MIRKANPPELNDFDDFYPFYVSQHNKPLCRILHFTGSALGMMMAAKALIRGPRWHLLLAPVVGYAFAWTGHFGVEKNYPASFGQPTWSFMGDWKMWATMAAGRDAELQSLGDSYLAEHPEVYGDEAGSPGVLDPVEAPLATS